LQLIHEEFEDIFREGLIHDISGSCPEKREDDLIGILGQFGYP
jgi:hypothetical protein